MTTSETNDIDLLMSLDPLSLSTQDLDAIIAYHRNQRAKREAGSRTAKAKKDTGPETKLDLTKLGLVAAPPKINRRI